jgi:Tol biopolymer transport system component
LFVPATGPVGKLPGNSINSANLPIRQFTNAIQELRHDDGLDGTGCCNCGKGGYDGCRDIWRGFGGGAGQCRAVIDITKGVVEPMPIAMPVFGGSNPATINWARRSRASYAADLERSGCSSRSTSGRSSSRADVRRAAALPGLAHHQRPDAGCRLGEAGAGGKYSVEFRLWDVFGGAEMFAQSYNMSPDIWRRVAHIIADDIYKRITGEEGYFDTRIVYIAESGPRTTGRSASPSWTRTARTISS